MTAHCTYHLWVAYISACLSLCFILSSCSSRPIQKDQSSERASLKVERTSLKVEKDCEDFLANLKACKLLKSYRKICLAKMKKTHSVTTFQTCQSLEK